MSGEAVLIEGLNAIELSMAKSLLNEAGIPSIARGPDFDVAELGRAAHDMLRGQDLLVPASALERAQSVLEQAWGPDFAPPASGGGTAPLAAGPTAGEVEGHTAAGPEAAGPLGKGLAVAGFVTLAAGLAALAVTVTRLLL